MKQNLYFFIRYEKIKQGENKWARVEYVLDNVKILLHKPHPRKEIPMYAVLY